MAGSVAIVIHGAAQNGAGGFAAMIRRGDGQPGMTITGGNIKTTANRMELAAAIEALRNLNAAG